MAEFDAGRPKPIHPKACLRWRNSGPCPPERSWTFHPRAVERRAKKPAAAEGFRQLTFGLPKALGRTALKKPRGLVASAQNTPKKSTRNGHVLHARVDDAVDDHSL